MSAWFKFYGRDFRDGVLGVLSHEEIGIYVVLLTLLYDGEGKIKNDDHEIIGRIRCDMRVWKRVKDKLCRYGKIVPTEDHFLINHRVIKEASYAAAVAELRRSSGRAGGQQSGKIRANRKKTNETSEAIASDLLPYTRAFSETQNTERDSPSLRSGEVVALKRAPKPTPHRGTRCPDFQTLPDDWRLAALAEGMTDEEIAREYAKMRDWSWAAAGSKGVKRDWLAAWRNWCRGRDDRRPSHAGPRVAVQRKSGATLILEQAGLLDREN